MEFSRIVLHRKMLPDGSLVDEWAKEGAREIALLTYELEYKPSPFEFKKLDYLMNLDCSVVVRTNLEFPGYVFARIDEDGYWLHRKVESTKNRLMSWAKKLGWATTPPCCYTHWTDLRVFNYLRDQGFDFSEF